MNEINNRTALWQGYVAAVASLAQAMLFLLAILTVAMNQIATQISFDVSGRVTSNGGEASTGAHDAIAGAGQQQTARSDAQRLNESALVGQGAATEPGNRATGRSAPLPARYEGQSNTAVAAYGQSNNGVVASGQSSNSMAAYGQSRNGVAGYGPSNNGGAAYGPSSNGVAAYGQMNTGVAAYGSSSNGVAISGVSNRNTSDYGRTGSGAAPNGRANSGTTAKGRFQILFSADRQTIPAEMQAQLIERLRENDTPQGRWHLWARVPIDDSALKRAAYLRLLAVRSVLLAAGVAPSDMAIQMLDGEASDSPGADMAVHIDHLSAPLAANAPDTGAIAAGRVESVDALRSAP